jgi:hypothetical protein
VAQREHVEWAFNQTDAAQIADGFRPDDVQALFQALNRLAKRQVLDLLYEPRSRHRAPDSENT